MSRAVVRAQIKQFLGPEGLPSPVQFCSEVIAHPPKVTSEARFDTAQWAGSGGLIFVFLPYQTEKRIALGGAHDGRKWRRYSCELICVFRSNKQTAEELGADFDTFLDSLVERIQSDRNFGTGGGNPTGELTPGCIFQAGEGDDEFGGEDIAITTQLPHTMRGGVTEVIARVAITVVEILNT